MRALFVYKYLTVGGVETVLRTRLEGLAACGIDAHAWFLAEGPGRALFRGLEDRVHVGGLHDLERHLDLQPPDVLTTIDTPEAFPALSELASPVRLVVEIHSPYRENRVYLYWIRRLPIAAFFVPSAYQASVVRKRAADVAPVVVVPNPLHDAFTQEAPPFACPPPLPMLAWIGRLDAVKNWRAFLRIGAALRRRDVPSELCLVGDGPGPAAERLYRGARRAGVLGRLRWYRSLPHESMPAFLDAVRESGGLLISTSREESFGMTVAEAMARRCAVVVPARGPFLDLVQDGRHGALYRPGSARDAAAKVTRLMADGALREACGERGRERILATHAPERALPVLAQALRRAAAGSRPAG